MPDEKDELSTLVHGMKTIASPLRTFLSDLHAKYRTLNEGTIARDFPELEKADSKWFGICLVDMSGRMYEVGDTARSFTIQDIAKPFVYGLVLEDHGRDKVLSQIGIEPTTDTFDTIFADRPSYRLQNPMLNAGAIVTSSLLNGDNPSSQFNHMLEMFRRYVGHEVMADAPSFLSVRTSGHHYRALAHMMLALGMISEEVDQILDLFFQELSLLVTCRDLAMMAATLANKGVNPSTNERALDETYVKDILNVMYTSGMHNYTGEWAYRVGLPAKGSKSGAIIAVVPRQLGIAVFSPPLDSYGHSVRGIKICEELSQQFGLHIFDPNFGGSLLQDAMNERTRRSNTAQSRIARVFDES